MKTFKNCYDLAEILDFLRDEEKDKKIKEHIESCQECQEKMEDLKKIKEAIEQFKFPEYPKGLDEKIEEKIKRISEEEIKMVKKPILKSIYIPIAAISIVILFALGIFILDKYKKEKGVITKEVKISLKVKEIKVLVNEDEIESKKLKIKEIMKKAGGELEEEIRTAMEFKIKKGKGEDIIKELKKEIKIEAEPKDFKEAEKIIIKFKVLK